MADLYAFGQGFPARERGKVVMYKKGGVVMKLPEEERLKAYLGYFYDLLTPDQREVERQKMLKSEKK